MRGSRFWTVWLACLLLLLAAGLYLLFAGSIAWTGGMAYA